jgi:hypothetical protein
MSHRYPKPYIVGISMGYLWLIYGISMKYPGLWPAVKVPEIVIIVTGTF